MKFALTGVEVSAAEKSSFFILGKCVLGKAAGADLLLGDVRTV